MQVCPSKTLLASCRTELCRVVLLLLLCVWMAAQASRNLEAVPWEMVRKYAQDGHTWLTEIGLWLCIGGTGFPIKVFLVFLEKMSVIF